MAAHGKKYLEAREKVDRDNIYPLSDAVKLVKECQFAKFDESIEMAIRLGVDPRHADQMVRGTVILPNGTGKEVTIAVFAEGDDASAAKEAGADIVGSDDLVEKIQEGFTDFDIAIAHPKMMSKVGRLGKVLGPKGLMPNPKAGTVTPNVGQAVSEAKAGKIEYRVDKGGVVHALVGKSSFEIDALIENCSILIKTLAKARPPAVKGAYFRSATISSTMGPGIKFDVSDVLKD